MVGRWLQRVPPGMSEWLLQRATAVLMALYAVGIALRLALAPPQGYAGWQALFASQAMKLATFVFSWSSARLAQRQHSGSTSRISMHCTSAFSRSHASTGIRRSTVTAAKSFHSAIQTTITSSCPRSAPRRSSASSGPSVKNSEDRLLQILCSGDPV